MKKTKRKGFNFFRSYFDVYDMLKTDAEKVSFIDALLNKQFFGIDPDENNMQGQSGFAYVSQKHSIDAQTKGYEDKTKTKLTRPSVGGSVGGAQPPSVQGKGKEKGKEKEKEKEKEKVQHVYAKSIHDCFEKCLKSFPDHLHPKKGKPTDNWLDTIDKLERIDNIPLQTIIEITKKTRADDFWSKNFMSITKLRKTNGDGIPYIVVFNEKFKSNGQNNQNGINGNHNNESISEKVHRIMGRE